MERLLFLGVGVIAGAVRRALPELPAAGTTRSAPDARFASLSAIAAQDRAAVRRAAEGAHVLVSFPPDGSSDAEFAALCTNAAGVTYLSSTAVYASGVVTEATPATAEGERAQLRLAAEAAWQKVGASIVRLPAFYGNTSGLHSSLARGTFRMPGTGNNIVSRVHEDDAAQFVLAAFGAARGSLLLAGDREPASVAEVVRFVCALFDLPAPAVSEGEAIPASLRNDRRIDNRVTRATFGIELRYPTFREGYQAVRAARVLPDGS